MLNWFKKKIVTLTTATDQISPLLTVCLKPLNYLRKDNFQNCT